MSAFSLLEQIAVAASRLVDLERTIFEDLFVGGLTKEEVCERRQLSPELYAAAYRSMMRSLCGAGGVAGTETGSVRAGS